MVRVSRRHISSDKVGGRRVPNYIVIPQIYTKQINVNICTHRRAEYDIMMGKSVQRLTLGKSCEKHVTAKLHSSAVKFCCDISLP